MPRCILLECNKLHGFLRMNHFVDQGIVPCVRSKILDHNTIIDEIKDEFYTIKVVKETNETCIDCSTVDCDNCSELKNLYQDYGLPVKIKVSKSEFQKWRDEQLCIDTSSLFYYYKFFDANLFGKLIISSGYYCIEAIDESNSELIESTVFWKNDEVFSKTMSYFSKAQTDDILSYAQIIEKKMKTYLDFDYSIIINFAFTSVPYFPNDKFFTSNLLFYGLRTAYTKTDLEFSF